MKRKIILIGIVIVVLLAAAGLGYQQLTTSAAPAAPLQTTTVVRGTLAVTLLASGNVSPQKSAPLAFQTTGRIAQINVHAGETVQAGQVLLQLEPTDLAAALKSAQASLANAQAAYDAAQIKNAHRTDQLVGVRTQFEKAVLALQQAQSSYNAMAPGDNVGLTPQAAALQTAVIDYQAARAGYNLAAASINDDTALRAAQSALVQAQLAVDQARRNLDQAKLVAPFAGVVATINYSVGDSVGAAPAVVLVDLSALQVQAALAEVDVAHVKVGQTAELTLDALAGQTYTATVTAIGTLGTVSGGVVNYPVTLTLAKADPAIKPGMTAVMNIAIAQADNVLLVPTRAVNTEGNRVTVTVLRNGQSVATPVNTGLANGQSTEITSGLTEGDTIVVPQAPAQALPTPVGGLAPLLAPPGGGGGGQQQ